MLNHWDDFLENAGGFRLFFIVILYWTYPLKMVIFHSYLNVYQRVNTNTSADEIFFFPTNQPESCRSSRAPKNGGHFFTFGSDPVEMISKRNFR